MPALTTGYGYRDAVAVTPGASPLFSGRKVCRALHCAGTAGLATLRLASGASVQFYLPQGAVLPVEFTHVTAAAATNLVALA